jgi:membrane protease YdiL (CAAX protease family)
MKKKLFAILEVVIFLSIVQGIAHWAVPMVGRKYGGGIGNMFLAVVWILPPVLYVFLKKKKPSDYGFDFSKKWRASVHYGFWGLVVIALIQTPGFIAWRLLGSWGVAIILTLVIMSIIILLWIYKFSPGMLRIDWKLLVMILLLICPAVTAHAKGKDLTDIIHLQLFYLIVVGFGEEIRSRGYVQSRLNEAFGHPWMIWGTKFGPGLLIASVLFGLPHIYQIGAQGPNVLMGIGATLGGLCYGIVYERSGSFLGSFIVHGVYTSGFEIYRHIFS